MKTAKKENLEVREKEEKIVELQNVLLNISALARSGSEYAWAWGETDQPPRGDRPDIDKGEALLDCNRIFEVIDKMAMQAAKECL